MQAFIHYFLHFGFPVVIALVFFRKNWKQAYLLLIATMLVDLDHLLANPVFQADRCSVGFHPLHTSYAIGGYALLLFLPSPVRVVGVGLLFHMLADFVDCLFIYSRCQECLVEAPAYEVLKAVADWLGI